MIYNGAAITSKPIESSSTNHVANSNVNEVTTNQNVVVPSKPSPTKSLQVTMKDFDLLKVLGTGGKFRIDFLYGWQRFDRKTYYLYQKFSFHIIDIF